MFHFWRHFEHFFKKKNLVYNFQARKSKGDSLSIKEGVVKCSNHFKLF